MAAELGVVVHGEKTTGSVQTDLAGTDPVWLAERWSVALEIPKVAVMEVQRHLKRAVEVDLQRPRGEVEAFARRVVRVLTREPRLSLAPPFWGRPVPFEPQYFHPRLSEGLGKTVGLCVRSHSVLLESSCVEVSGDLANSRELG